MKTITIEIVRQALVPYQTFDTPVLSEDGSNKFEVNVIISEDIEPKIIIEALEKAKERLKPKALELNQLYEQVLMGDIEPTINKLIEDKLIT